MNDNKSKFPIGELAQSASSSSPKVDELAEKKKNQKKSLIKMGVMGVLTLILLIFSSLSWFTQNRETSVGDMQIKTATLPFDIATKGANVRNQSVINSKRSEYVEGSSGPYSNPSGTSGTYYTDDSLLLRYTPEVDDPNTTDVDESITPDISPGSSGELSLYVIPKTDSSMKVKVSLNVVAFAEIDKYDVSTVTNAETNEEETVYTNNGTQIVEITSLADFTTAANAVNNSTAASEAAKYIAAADYLKGHILFFGGLGETTTNSGSSGSETVWEYYYTTPYTSRIINQKIASGNEGKAVQVPIYWMWTNTLGQIALQTNTNNLRSGIPVVEESVINLTDDTDTDKELLLAYLNTNKSSVFTVTETITQDMIYNADALANFETLSKQYNAADYEIGTRIAYFMIEVTVESDS
ncbi:MAG: hypothetical protein K6F71_11115 [Ruminococcus sp.]|uniref:hypothetical protein n=1 Tax=Ruminococcus sp. TaxID=41978 RepID=UPI0025E6C164|nr:hypothetical protein [Ruminococcus sp.]MCR5541346.1 hypothetical protein [Ruminococcus sp.]